MSIPKSGDLCNVRGEANHDFDSRRLSSFRATKNALNKSFSRVEKMVEAVQRYSNSELNILSRLERALMRISA